MKSTIARRMVLRGVGVDGAFPAGSLGRALLGRKLTWRHWTVSCLLDILMILKDRTRLTETEKDPGNEAVLDNTLGTIACPLVF